MNSLTSPQAAPAWLSAGRDAAGQLPEGQRCAALAAFLAESESLAPLMMLHSLLLQEYCTDEGWQIDDRRHALRIAPCYSGLLVHWHRHLQEEGLLECSDEGIWTLSPCAPPAHQLEQRIDDARHRLRQLMNWLDDAAPLANALSTPSSQLDDWLRAPALAADVQPTADLHQLMQLPGIIYDYFSHLVASVLPPLLNDSPRLSHSLLALGQTPASLTACLAELPVTVVNGDPACALADQRSAGCRYDAVVIADVLHPDGPGPLFSELAGVLHPGAVLLLLHNTAERPLHWVTPAAVQAHARAAQALPHDEANCCQALRQSGFELLQVWPQPGTPMAFAGQRLFVARYAPALSTAEI